MNKEEIIQAYYPVIRRIVKRVIVKMPEGYDEEDFIQIGMLGLLKALENWDESRSVLEFKSYANTKIRGYILDKLRKIDPVSRYSRDRLKKIHCAYRELMDKGVFNPEDEEVARVAGISVDEFNDLLYKQSNATMLSIDEAISNSNAILIEAIENKHVKSPLAVLEDVELENLIKEGLRSLNDMELKILSLYYYEDFNIKEIAFLINRTESRVSQIKTKALIKLRAYIQRRLKNELDR